MKKKPKYNINLKDDKSYPYLKLTNEPFPRIFVTRTVKRDGGRYFGPFTDVKALRRTLGMVQKLFPLRRCKWKLPDKKPPRTCLNYHIKNCKGPCQGLISPEEYNEYIRQAHLLLLGRNNQLINRLKKDMNRASENLEFEHAAEIRDRLMDVERVIERQRAFSTTRYTGDWDVVVQETLDKTACGVIFEVRDGKIMGKKHFFLGGVEGKSEAEIISAFIKQVYLTSSAIPREIHVPVLPPDTRDIEAWFSDARGSAVKILVPRKGEKARLARMASKNALLRLDERKQRMEKGKDIVPRPVQALKRDLRLKKIPRLIDAVDISTFQGMDAAGSLISFRNGKPFKSRYRRFRIKTAEGMDDFGMMREVLFRRFDRLKKEGKDYPDLLLVDGGKGQLSCAVEILEKLGIDSVETAGLAKRLEEVFLPFQSAPQNIPKTSSSLHLLRSVRDEAHRFAVTYHRKLRTKRSLATGLDHIPGIGPSRRTALLKTFGSVKKIREASVDEIAAVAGFSDKLALVIKKSLA